MRVINYFSKPANAFLSGIVQLINDIGVMIITTRPRIACHVTFFEIVPYYQSSNAHYLSFLHRLASDEPIFHLSLVTYHHCPLLIHYWSFIQTTPSSSLSSIDVKNISTDALFMQAPNFPGDQFLPRRNPPRDHLFARYCASVTTIYSPVFLSFYLYSALTIGTLSLIQRLQNFQNNNMLWTRN